MKTVALMDKYIETRYMFFKWRYSLTLVNKIALALGMAGLTGILAQIYIFLPFTPVPVTGQVLGVLLSGIVCGGLFGAVSQVLYVTLGMFGMPWFHAGTSGSWTSPTIGYFIGFIIASFLIGKLTDRYIRSRTFGSQLKIMMMGVGIIYLFGAIGLAVVLKTGFWATITKAIIPFIIFDLVKAAVAGGIGFLILPKASYNGEVDKLKYSSGKENG